MQTGEEIILTLLPFCDECFKIKNVEGMTPMSLVKSKDLAKLLQDQTELLLDTNI